MRCIPGLTVSHAAQPNAKSVFAERTHVSPRTEEVSGCWCACHMQIDNPVPEKTSTSWTCGPGGSCCGTAPSSPAITVSGAGPGAGARGRGRAAGVPAMCRAGFIREGHQAASYLFPNPMGFLPLSGPQSSHFEMELGSRVHQAPVQFEYLTLKFKLPRSTC